MGLSRFKTRRSITILASSLGVALLVYFGVCWQVLNLLMTPERKSRPIPTAAEINVNEIRPVPFKSLTDDITLQGWFMPHHGASNQGNRAVILLHGVHSTAWNCINRDVAKAYFEAGFSVFLYDLRGHGRSEGNYLGLGLLERGDVRAAVDLLLAQGFRPGEIGIHGSSYGAGVTLLAVEDIEEIGAVISDSAFAAMSDVVGGELNRQTGAPPAVSRLLMPGLKLIGQIQYSVDISQSTPEQSIKQIVPRPILLIHGDQDEVIPYSHAERLQQAAGPETELWRLSSVKHVEGVRSIPDCEIAPTRDEFLTKITEFFDTHLGEDKSQTARL